MSTPKRLIEIVKYLSEVKSPQSVTAVSKALNSNKSSTFRMLSSLKQAQWVIQDAETKKYRLGSEVLLIGLSLLSDIDIRSTSMPFLEALSNKTSESATLTLRIGLERVYIEQTNIYHEVRHIAPIGRRLPLWRGAPGKAIFAYLSEHDSENVLRTLRESGEQILASGQIVNADKLLLESDEIRKQGFALSFGERVIGIGAVACPIFDYRRQVAGAISLSGPMPRFNQEAAVQYSHLVKQAARDISAQLGCNPNSQGQSE